MQFKMQSIENCLILLAKVVGEKYVQGLILSPKVAAQRNIFTI